MKKNYILTIILSFLAISVYSQKLSTSPLSRYGVGNIFFQGNTREASLGNTAIADYTSLHISKINPAALTATAFNSVIFEFSAFNKYSVYNTSVAKQPYDIVTMKSISGGFRVTKWWHTAFGITPFSGSGYNISTYDTARTGNYTNPYQVDYIGDGGINQLYWSNAVSFFRKLSIGANINYNFGSLDRRTNMIFNNDSDYVTIDIIKERNLFKKFTYDFGILYTDTIKRNGEGLVSFALGGIYSNKYAMKTITTKFNILSYAYPARTFIDTLTNDTISSSTIELPQTFGGGISLKYKENLILNADYIVKKWSNTSILGEKNFVDTRFMGVGLEYCRSPFSAKFLRTIRYRIGAYQYNSYLKYKNNQVNTQAITFGLGIPMRTVMLNAGFVIGRTGSMNIGFQENFYEIHLGISLYDIWFVKRKYM